MLDVEGAAPMSDFRVGMRPSCRMIVNDPRPMNEFVRRTVSAASLLLAAFCFWNAWSASHSVATPSQTVQSPRQLLTIPIQDVRPGMRVQAENPEIEQNMPDTVIHPKTWRLVKLHLQKSDGSGLDVELLRPLDWLIVEAMQMLEGSDHAEALIAEAKTVPAGEPRLVHLLQGATIHLDLPELGARGPAEVVAITPCPEIEPAAKGKRLVTGTFRHAAANVIDMTMEGEANPLGVTDNHPFWSADRQEFVEAGRLQVGERLQRADGTLTQLTRITPRRGPPVPVFNFEVDVAHTYHVGANGVLVHNACALPFPRAATHGSPLHNHIMNREALLQAGRSGVTNVRTNQALSDGTHTLSQLRPDVQYWENGLLHVIEVNVSGGPNYHALREDQLRSILGSLMGNYAGL